MEGWRHAAQIEPGYAFGASHNEKWPLTKCMLQASMKDDVKVSRILLLSQPMRHTVP